MYADCVTALLSNHTHAYVINKRIGQIDRQTDGHIPDGCFTFTVMNAVSVKI